ncbi:MAG: hypothetical protein KY458_09330 [Actinobacteria bacterium]|nr:hypothetical protein [Actinomycetota bacterium]
MLVVVYVALSLLNDPGGYLGTDTGGKVATLKVMTERGHFDPDLGYWAEEWDASGALHPIGFTAHTTSGRWVNVTTLPALYAGWHLYRVGGYRGALLVPMAGSVAAALAALALLRRLGVSERRAWGGYWLVGLASPLTIYALDFWEHSVGVALTAWAVVLVVDAWQRGTGRGAWRALTAGALLGSAATMRTETLVYLAVVGLALVVVLFLRGVALPKVVLAGAFLVLGAVVPLVINEVAERRVVGSSIRGTRAVATAVSAGDAPAGRLKEAAVTTVGADGDERGVVLGAGIALLLVIGALRRDKGVAVGAVAGAGALLGLRMGVAGLGFVPGLLVAAPFAAAAVAVRRRGETPPAGGAGLRRDVAAIVVAIGVGAVPLVLATQFRGGAAPQWGGRYLLVSGALLAVVGWALLSERPRPVQAGFAVLSVAVTLFGLSWMSVRTREVARTIDALDRRPESVIVSGVYHLAREGGAFYGNKRWLTLGPLAGPPAAASVLTAAGVSSFASVELAEEPPLHYPGFELVNTGGLRLFDGVQLRVSSWRRGS